MAASMDLTRRQILTAAAAGATLTVAACGCGTSPAAGAAKAPVAAGPVDIGTIGDYPMDGVYDRFADSHDFFVVREGNRLFALSAICTHRECPLKLIHGGIKC